MVIMTGYTLAVIRSIAISELVTTKLPTGITLNHLPGGNVLVYALLMLNIVAGTLGFSGYNFARNPNFFV